MGTPFPPAGRGEGLVDQVDFHRHIRFSAAAATARPARPAHHDGQQGILQRVLLKMSAKDVLTTARKPNCVSAHGACSRELPQPKLSHHAGQGAGRGGQRAGRKCAPALPLPPFKTAIAGGNAVLAA